MSNDQPTHESALSALLHETRASRRRRSCAAQANAKADVYDEAAADRLGVLGGAGAALTWDNAVERGARVVDAPFAKWFVGGTLNAAVNCVDRHVDAGNGDKVAFHWEGEPDGDTERRHHLRRPAARGQQGRERADRAGGAAGRPGRDLHADDPGDGRRDAGLRPARRAAHRGVLRLLRRGAVEPDPRLRLHSWSSPADGGTAAARRRRSSRRSTRRWRRVRAWRRCSSYAVPAQDVAWNDEPRRVVARRRRPAVRRSTRREAFDAEHPLFIMYTSGTTAKPKGILHTTGGYLTQVAYTHRWSSTSSPTPTSTGAPPTSAGSPGTPTSSTGRWPTARRR